MRLSLGHEPRLAPSCYASLSRCIALPDRTGKERYADLDLPLRLFHWGLVIAVIGAISSAKLEILWLHERFGLAVMGLVGFRLVWGFYGGHYARFAQFLVATPRPCKY